MCLVCQIDARRIRISQSRRSAGRVPKSVLHRSAMRLALSECQHARKNRGGLLRKVSYTNVSTSSLGDRALDCQPRQLQSCTQPQSRRRRLTDSLERRAEWAEALDLGEFSARAALTNVVPLIVCGPSCRMICRPVNRQFHSNSPMSPC